MLSSTFNDLDRHRAALISAVESQGLHAVAMENDSAKPIDIIDSSLRMVRETSAYIGIIGRRYGQRPPSKERNPRKLSITEIEFNEAERLGRPILLFLMGNDHPPGVEEETNTGRKRLSKFRERAKQMGPDSRVHRVYATFNSLDDFALKATKSVAGLRRYLEERVSPTIQAHSPDPALSGILNQAFISYWHESPEHARAVRRLGELLRQAQIPVMFDRFFLDKNPSGPDIGWSTWYRECAAQSQRVLIVASEGWFAAYDENDPLPGSDAAVLREMLRNGNGDNGRISLVLLHEIPEDKIPCCLRGAIRFCPFTADDQLDQLIRWLAEGLGLHGIRSPTVCWPAPVAFQPDLADRRHREWPAVVDLLSGRSRERILLLEADSGFGKSAIVHQANAYARGKLDLLVAVIDLKSEMFKVEDVLKQIYLELCAHLPNFSREGASKTDFLLQDLRALRRPVVLLFDGYEVAAENKAIADWIGQQILNEVETTLSLAVIVAGKSVPDFAQAGWRDLVRHIRLEPILEVKPWQEWFALRNPGFQDLDHLRSIVKIANGIPAAMVTYCAALAKG